MHFCVPNYINILLFCIFTPFLMSLALCFVSVCLFLCLSILIFSHYTRIIILNILTSLYTVRLLSFRLSIFYSSIPSSYSHFIFFLSLHLLRSLHFLIFFFPFIFLSIHLFLSFHLSLFPSSSYPLSSSLTIFSPSLFLLITFTFPRNESKAKKEKKKEKNGTFFKALTQRGSPGSLLIEGTTQRDNRRTTFWREGKKWVVLGNIWDNGEWE